MERVRTTDMIAGKWVQALSVMALSLLLAVPALADADLQAALRKPLRAQTPCYRIHGDAPEHVIQEAALRLEKMADVYRTGAAGASDQPDGRLPVFLLLDERDFLAAGGTRDSAGLYRGGVLIALAEPGQEAQIWRVLQHEGFHQFAERAFPEPLPIWLNEGLAEYFGQSAFTGDGFVSGLVPDWRLKRVREDLAGGRFLPLRRLLELSPVGWERLFALRNYDQAWTLVYFLLHGEEGRYAEGFLRFVADVGSGVPWPRAWKEHLPVIPQLERDWRRYWTSLPDDPTAGLRLLATAQTLNSLLARAVSQGQSFESFDAFLKAATAGELKCHPDDWLPPTLLLAIEEARISGDWSIRNGQLHVRVSSGSQLIGVYVIENGRVLEARMIIDVATDGGR